MDLLEQIEHAVGSEFIKTNEHIELLYTVQEMISSEQQPHSNKIVEIL
ncbi:TPA: hypothetical protein ACT9AQ_001162 [Legionella pneumophila]|nr:hypothetical protein [Legionella pneumophila]HDO8078937.1 hypothetical protein [Legionella pneumophila]HDO8153375.1 hypothetical protein [Legionella pneumophila]